MSTPVRILKIPCLDAGPWSNTGVRVMNHVIPADLGVVDLDKSYLLLQMSATTSETLAEHEGALRPVAIAPGETDIPPYDSDCLIMNAYLDSERAGRLEDAPDNRNILGQALNFYGRSGADIESATVYNGTFQYDEYQRPHSNFRDLRYLGDPQCTNIPDNRATAVLQPEVKIPLNKIVKFADGMTQCPLFATGDLTLHTELQDNTIKVMHVHQSSAIETFAPVDISGTDATLLRMANHYYDPGNFRYHVGAPISLTYTTYNTSAGLTVAPNSSQVNWYASDPNFALADGAVVLTGNSFESFSPMDQSGAVKGLTLQLNYTNPDEDAANPYDQTKLTLDVSVGSAGLYPGTTFVSNINDVSMYFEIQGINGGTTGVTHDTIISGLQWVAPTGPVYDADTTQVVVELADPLPDVASGWAAGYFETPAPESDTPDTEIIQADLVVHQLLLNDQQLGALQSNINAGVQIPYMTWKSQEVNVTDSETNFAYTYDLPPMCGNALLLKPPNDSLIGVTDGVTDYNFRINGTDTTDIPVTIREPLYHDRILETWTNMNKDLKNLDEKYSLDTTEENYNADVVPMVACQPVPLMPEASLLDFRCRSTGMTPSKMRCYSQKQRTLKLTGQKAEVLN
jgi:hypothetical protein